MAALLAGTASFFDSFGVLLWAGFQTNLIKLVFLEPELGGCLSESHPPRRFWLRLREQPLSGIWAGDRRANSIVFGADESDLNIATAATIWPRLKTYFLATPSKIVAANRDPGQVGMASLPTWILLVFKRAHDMKTFERLENELPNGFHDARIMRVKIDFVGDSIEFEMDMLTGQPGTLDRDRRRLGVLRIYSPRLFFCRIGRPRTRIMGRG